MAASGLSAQSRRLQIVSENLANANASPAAPGERPYSRKIAVFDTVLDEVTGHKELKVVDVARDRAPFRVERNPGHPAADAEGNVRLPNVNPLVELTDMREANRSYQANLQVVRQTREIVAMTIDLLKVNS